MPAPADFETPNKPTWCPGCGNFGMWMALRNAYANLGLSFEQLAVVWGIGCHGNGADFTKAQGFHGLHGRALPAATGLKLANPDLTVVVEMGDGDGYGIGLGHYAHTCRRNLDMTIVAHNNQVYGLTTGQTSPTSDLGMKTVSTPFGVLEQPVDNIALAIVEGATWVARGFAGDMPHLTSLIEQAIQHKGISVLDVFQPCVTFNKVNTFQWFRERVYKLEDGEWDQTDKAKAIQLTMDTHHALTCEPESCRIPLGVIYREEGRPTYEEGLPQLTGPLWKQALQPRDITAAMMETA